jgi:RNA polymerase sigma-70 factor, ECF subfamily
MPDTTPPGSAPDERELIARARDGDRNAFRRLVEHHMKQAYAVAYSFVRNHHSAEEVAQEAFVRVHRGLSAYRGEAEFATWLYRIVTNLALNRLRATRRRGEREVYAHADILEHAAYRESTDILDQGEHIERALHELPTMQRAVVILRHVDGLSTRQVSSILGCSEGTVKTHLFRGLKAMRKKLSHLREEA